MTWRCQAQEKGLALLVTLLLQALAFFVSDPLLRAPLAAATRQENSSTKPGCPLEIQSAWRQQQAQAESQWLIGH